ncbi:XdhC family protein [Cupriavidus sp. 8B]
MTLLRRRVGLAHETDKGPYDAKLDNIELLEAPKSPAFCVRALGSRGNTAKHKERLALFDLGPAAIKRLHGPVGLHLGAQTPA